MTPQDIAHELTDMAIDLENRWAQGASYSALKRAKLLREAAELIRTQACK